MFSQDGCRQTKATYGPFHCTSEVRFSNFSTFCVIGNTPSSHSFGSKGWNLVKHNVVSNMANHSLAILLSSVEMLLVRSGFLILSGNSHFFFFLKVLTFVSILLPRFCALCAAAGLDGGGLMSRRYTEKQSNLCQNAPVSQCARDVTGSRSEASAVISLICMSSLASAPGQWTCR